MSHFDYVLADQSIDFLPPFFEVTVDDIDFYNLPPHVRIGFGNTFKRVWDGARVDAFAIVPCSYAERIYGMGKEVFRVTEKLDFEDVYWQVAARRITLPDFNFEDIYMANKVGEAFPNKDGSTRGFSFVAKRVDGITVSLPTCGIKDLRSSIYISKAKATREELFEIGTRMRSERAQVLKHINRIQLSEYLKRKVKNDPRIIQSHMPPMSVCYRANALKEFSTWQP